MFLCVDIYAENYIGYIGYPQLIEQYRKYKTHEDRDIEYIEKKVGTSLCNLCNFGGLF